ncbi:MAG: hypothetical protein K2G33_08475, partial [Duncaniella sp.]|nr:hypothetical protein [Duncaniella sp.]
MAISLPVPMPCLGTGSFLCASMQYPYFLFITLPILYPYVHTTITGTSVLAHHISISHSSYR